MQIRTIILIVILFISNSIRAQLGKDFKDSVLNQKTFLDSFLLEKSAKTKLNSNFAKIIKTDSIVLKLENGQIILLNDTQPLNLKIRLENNLDSDFIFYGFKELSGASSNEDRYCNDDIAAAMKILVLRKDSLIKPNAPMENIAGLDHFPNKDEFVEIWNNVTEEYYMNMEVIKKRKSQVIILQNCLNDYVLKDGEYEFYLIYHCGKNLTNIVDITTINNDKKRYKASVFRGCIKSNKIKLTIKYGDSPRRRKFI